MKLKEINDQFIPVEDIISKQIEVLGLHIDAPDPYKRIKCLQVGGKIKVKEESCILLNLIEISFSGSELWEVQFLHEDEPEFIWL